MDDTEHGRSPDLTLAEMRRPESGTCADGDAFEANLPEVLQGAIAYELDGEDGPGATTD